MRAGVQPCQQLGYPPVTEAEWTMGVEVFFPLQVTKRHQYCKLDNLGGGGEVLVWSRKRKN